jgi:hypothetical protein
MTPWWEIRQGDVIERAGHAIGTSATPVAEWLGQRICRTMTEPKRS